MSKNKKVLIVALVLVTILSTSITGQAASNNCYSRTYSIKGFTANRGYSINSLLNNYNNSSNRNWQIITLPSSGNIYEDIFDNIITRPSKPSESNVPETPEEAETPETPEEESTPVEPEEETKTEKPELPEQEEERPETPEKPKAPEKPVTPEKPEQPKQEEPAPSNSLSAQEQEVVRLVNIERQKAGLSPLSVSNKLSDVARLKSKDMADNRYFSHTSPTYGSPFDMMKQFGISYRTAGENIAKGYLSAESVVNGWMNSSGHRANILNPSFGTIGVGAYKTGNTIYWTQMFTN